MALRTVRHRTSTMLCKNSVSGIIYDRQAGMGQPTPKIVAIDVPPLTMVWPIPLRVTSRMTLSRRVV